MCTSRDWSITGGLWVGRSSSKVCLPSQRRLWTAEMHVRTCMHISFLFFFFFSWWSHLAFGALTDTGQSLLKMLHAGGIFKRCMCVHGARRLQCPNFHGLFQWFVWFLVFTQCSPRNSTEGCAVIYLVSKEYFRHGKITHLNTTLQQEYWESSVLYFNPPSPCRLLLDAQVWCIGVCRLG